MSIVRHCRGDGSIRSRIALVLAAAAVSLVFLAAAAFAEQAVWLDWVGVSANTTDQWSYHKLNYVETEPKSYSYGCANAQINNLEYFESWYCSTPERGYQSAYMGGTDNYAQAWNDNGHNQDLWAWAGYEP